MAYRWYDAENKVVSEQWLVDLKTGRKQFFDGDATWMPATDRYYFTEKIGGKKCLKAVDPLTNSVTILAKDMPDEWFVISPTEQYAIISPKSEGTKKEEGVFEIIHPDDRQPDGEHAIRWQGMTSGQGLRSPSLTLTATSPCRISPRRALPALLGCYGHVAAASDHTQHIL